MPESSKYDFFMDELSSLEKQLYKFVQLFNEQAEERKTMLKKIKQLENENEVLKLKVEDIESKLNNTYIDAEDSHFNNLYTEVEKEKLKEKINDLLTKIDFHLRS